MWNQMYTLEFIAYDFAFKAFNAAVFWFFWSYVGVGKTFFAFLPNIYLNPSFIEVFGLFAVVGVGYAIFLPPFKVSVTQNKGG